MTDKKGFTLVEIIVAILIGALLAGMFVQYMGRAFTGGSEPVGILKDTYTINGVLEKVTAAYNDDVKNEVLDLAIFNANLSSFDENGVACTGKFVEYRSTTGNLIDANSDGVYEVQDSTGPPLRFLLVTASKNDRSLQVLFAD